jgi:hypothetical protein
LKQKLSKKIPGMSSRTFLTKMRMKVNEIRCLDLKVVACLDHSFSYIHSHSFTFIHIHSHSFTFIHIHSHSFTFIHIHSRSFTFIHIHSHSFTFIHIHSHSFTYTHTYTRAQADTHHIQTVSRHFCVPYYTYVTQILLRYYSTFFLFL